MILVTAAYGNQGRILVPKLAAAGLKVRAMRQRPRPQELIALGAAEVFIGDAADPKVLREAMEGVDAVYHVGPTGHAHERAMGFCMVDAALDAGVRHVVFSSVLHPIVTELIQHKLKRDIEEYLVSSGLNFTILQPSDYMQQSLQPAVFEAGQLTWCWDFDRPQAMVDLEDMAEVTVRVLSEGGRHYGATYELSAENISANRMAAGVSRAMGREVVPKLISSEDLLNALMAAQGREGDFTQERAVIEGFCRWYNDHDFIGNSVVLEMLLGRAPTTWDEFARRTYTAYTKVTA